MNHDIPRLEIAEHEIVAVGLANHIGKTVELCFETRFVEDDGGVGFHKIVFEIVEVVDDSSLIKAGNRVDFAVVESLMTFGLQAHQLLEDLLEHSNRIVAILTTPEVALNDAEKGLVAHVRLKVAVALLVDGQQLGYL